MILIGAIEKALFRPMKMVQNANHIGHEGLTMIIDHQPPVVQAFFSLFRRSLTKPQFHHLWTLILAWVVHPGRRTVLNLATHIPQYGHRTSLGRFLTTAPWDGPALMDQQVQRLLASMKPRRGETIHLLIDDSRIAKRGRQMYAVGPIWVPTRGAFTYGHQVVTAAILFRGIVLPWRFDLWVPKKWAGRNYRKSTQIAAAFIEAFTPPRGLKVHVLFDAFYLTPVVVRACENRGFSWFSVASKNRVLSRARQHQRRRIIDLVAGLLRHQGRSIRMKRDRGVARFRIAMVDGRLKGIGPVRMVVRKRPGAAMATATAIVTNQRCLDPRTIVLIYERRWRIEMLFKELRSDLGLGEYQVISREGILHHLHLCGLVHLMLTHHSMDAVGAQARKVNREVTLPPMRRRLESLRELIRADQIRRLLRHETNTRQRKRLERYLLAA